MLGPLKTSSQRSNKTLKRRIYKMSWRCSIETSLAILFETYPQHRSDVQRGVVTTSPRRLVAGSDVVDNDVGKKTVLNNVLVKKVNTIDTNELVK